MFGQDCHINEPFHYAVLFGLSFFRTGLGFNNIINDAKMTRMNATVRVLPAAAIVACIISS
jgi:hypothetical protein